MSFLVALGLLVGLFRGGVSIYEFAKSRQRPGAVLAIIAIGLLVGAFFLGNVSSLFANKGPDVSFTPVTSSQQTVTGSSPTQAQPTPTSPPSPGTVLYQADQSWNAWSGSGGWKVSDGLLLNDGTYADYKTMPTITAPYQPGGVADYAVEIKMQVVSAMATGSIYPCLYVTARGTSVSDGWHGYAAAICVDSANGPAIQINAIDTSNNSYDRLSSTPFDPQNAEHTYRLEVKGTAIRFLVDGGSLLTADDSRFLDGGQIGLRSDYMEVKISSFQIIAL